MSLLTVNSAARRARSGADFGKVAVLLGEIGRAHV